MCKPLSELNYYEPHAHSDFSDGFNVVEDDVKRAIELGYPAAGRMDHGTGSGLGAQSKICIDNGIKPSLGIEFYFRIPNEWGVGASDNSRSGRYHITMLATSFDGYCRLIGINNAAHRNMEVVRGVKYPISTLDMYEEYAGDGLVVMTGCIASVTFHDDNEVAEHYVSTLIRTFGKGNVYAEVMPHKITKERDGVRTISNSYERPVALAQKFNLPTIFCNDTHAAREEDLETLEQYTKTTKGYSFTAGHLLSKDEAFKVATDVIGTDEALKALNGNDHLYNRLEVIDFKRKFQLPQADAEVKILKEFLVKALAEDKKSSGLDAIVLQERYDYEYDMIERNDFFPYFAVLVDILHHAHKNGVETISRGSAAGSYLWYLMEGSDLNPVEHGLSFERFLAQLRLTTGELPDIDIDMDADMRHIVQEYAKKRWGFEPVGTILTYNHSSLVQLVGRALRNDTFSETPSKELLMKVSGLPTSEAKQDESFKKLMKMAPWALKMYNGLMGARSGYGRHACAVVPLRDDMPVPIEAFGSEPVVAWTESGSNKSLLHAGFVKYDFLSLNSLAVFAALQRKTGVKAPKVIKDNDPCFELFNTVNASGLFQFDTPIGRNLLTMMRDNGRKITSIRMLADLTSLGRPGPLHEDYHTTYIEKTADLSKHPKFIREIFEETGGVIIYQEQVSKLYATLSFIEDSVHARESGVVALKALVPKNQKVAETQEFKDKYAKLKDDFVSGGIKFHELEETYVDELFSSLVGFVRYGFNLSHALSYANLSAKIAWFKYNYPSEFWGVVLDGVKNSKDDRGKLLRYLVDAMRSSGLKIVAPHINTGGNNYALSHDKKSIQCPIHMVVGIGDKKVQQLLKERENNGPFLSLADFNSRVQLAPAIKKSLYFAKMFEGLDGDLVDLGVRAKKIFSPRGKQWEAIETKSRVQAIDNGTITLDNGRRLTINKLSLATDEVKTYAKSIGFKTLNGATHLSVGTYMKYVEYNGILIANQRLEYVEPEPKAVSFMKATREALGFVLPDNLVQVMDLVDKSPDAVVGFVVGIEEKQTAKTNQVKFELHTGHKVAIYVDDRTKDFWLMKKAEGDLRYKESAKRVASEIKLGDLIGVRLVMVTDPEPGEPITYNQVKRIKVLA